MKAKLIFAVLVAVLVLVGRESATVVVPTKTVIPSETSTPVPPTSSSKPTMLWIVATSLDLTFSSSNEITSIIDKLHPYKCIRENLLTVNPTPIEPAMQVSWLRFTEIDTFPEPNPNYSNAHADNIDKSRTAFAGCQPRDCSKLYVKDNKSGKSYEIKFGATTDRPLDYLQWINKDTVIIAQQGHLWTLIVAINVEKKEFEYYGMTPGCPMATPKP